MTDTELLTVSQAAAACNATSQTIRNWIRADRLRAVRIGNRFLIPKDEVERLRGALPDDSAESPWDYAADSDVEPLRRRVPRARRSSDPAEGVFGG